MGEKDFLTVPLMCCPEVKEPILPQTPQIRDHVGSTEDSWVVCLFSAYSSGELELTQE